MKCNLVILLVLASIISLFGVLVTPWCAVSCLLFAGIAMFCKILDFNPKL